MLIVAARTQAPETNQQLSLPEGVNVIGLAPAKIRIGFQETFDHRMMRFRSKRGDTILNCKIKANPQLCRIARANLMIAWTDLREIIDVLNEYERRLNRRDITEVPATHEELIQDWR
jgi:hypothetical protein